jgi:hypothetical protein
MKRKKKLTWSELIEQSKHEPKLYYSSSSYYQGDLIDHSKFG